MNKEIYIVAKQANYSNSVIFIVSSESFSELHISKFDLPNKSKLHIVKLNAM